MANVIGSEVLMVDVRRVKPTAALVQGGVACAVFYVDPRSAVGVRWRTPSSTVTTEEGFPLAPGAWISVAGEGNIRNSTFVVDGAGTARVHALYFDRVDVVAGNFITAAAVTEVKPVEELLRDVLVELRKIKQGMSLLVNSKLTEEDI